MINLDVLALSRSPLVPLGQFTVSVLWEAFFLIIVLGSIRLLNRNLFRKTNKIIKMFLKGIGIDFSPSIFYNSWANIIYYVFLLRVPIVSGLVFFSFPLIAQFVAPNFLQNVFVIETGKQLASVIIFSILTSIIIVSLSKTILVLIVDSPNNFDADDSINKNNDFRKFRLITTIILVLPTWITLFKLNSQIERFYSLLGLVISLVILSLVFIYEYKDELNIQILITTKNRRTLFFTVEALVGIVFYLLVIYFNWPQDVNNTPRLSNDLQAPTLLYLLLILWILTLFVGLVTFIFDRSIDDELDIQREQLLNFVEPAALSKMTPQLNQKLDNSKKIEEPEKSKKSEERKNIEKNTRFYNHTFNWPVVLFLVVFSALSYGVFGVDHFFELKNSNNPLVIKDYRQDFQQAVWNRICKDKFDATNSKQVCKENEEQPLVVVAASGGGIQASGWMTQVLAGLQDQELGIGEDFTKAITLISSASGGSVGSMFYVDQFNDQGVLSQDAIAENNQENKLAKVVENATNDWLNAVGWGLAFPDLFRSIGFPFVLNWVSQDSRYLDRGYALEKTWQKTLVNKDSKYPTLDSRRKQILDGQVPITVFNTTLVENGRRFLVSPMKFVPGTMTDYLKEPPEKNITKALDFRTLYNNCGKNHDQACDLSMTTASRLSASFPYVTPMSRNYPDNLIPVKGKETHLQNYHIADGGYFDNAGIFTAMEWLNNFLKYNSKSSDHQINIKKVVLLQINAFPEDKLQIDQKGKPGFIVDTIGPIDTLAGIRDATQVARNQTFANLLKDRWDDNVKIQDFTISFPEMDKQGKPYNPPLSWRLTDRQKLNLKDAWKNDQDIRNTVLEMKKFWSGDQSII